EAKLSEPWRSDMRRFRRLLVGLGVVLAGSFQAGLPVRGEESKVRALGEGPAYDQVGKLAVMHAGRVKPLDTVAREEVKHVFGRETIKLHDASNTLVETWGPVAAFLDWMVRPEFWDEQPFVLVDYLPLRQAILTDSSRLGEEHKWLTPRELEDAKISHQGQTTAFMEWVAGLDEQKQKFDANPRSAERLSETERRAIDAGRRLMTYKAYSGDEVRSAGIVRVMPRPFSFKALGYVTQVIKKARESKNLRDLAPIE